MAIRNYGIIVTPIGLLFVIVGIIFANVFSGNGQIIGIVAAILGVIILFIGISRLVQGKDRKIMGQIVRPKAAARGSAIWAALFFNITPLLMNNPDIMANGPPFPLFILGQVVYDWLPFVVIGFMILWILGFLFSGKFPKAIYIFFNWIITISLTFYVNFGLYFFLSTFYADKTGNFLLESWADATTIAELTTPLIISVSILIASIFFLTRMIRNLKISFSNLNVKKKHMLIVNIIIIFAYISAVSPIVFMFSFFKLSRT